MNVLALASGEAITWGDLLVILGVIVLFLFAFYLIRRL